MNAIPAFETSVTIYQSTRHNIQEYVHLQKHRSCVLKSIDMCGQSQQQHEPSIPLRFLNSPQHIWISMLIPCGTYRHGKSFAIALQGRCILISITMQACIHTYIHTYIRTYIHSFIHTYIHTYTTSVVKRPTKCLHFMGHKSNLTFLMELGNTTCYTESSWCEGLKNERWGIIQHNTDTIFHITHIGPRRIWVQRNALRVE